MVSNANANNIPAYRLHSKFVKNIMDSMILWYDLKRQGATNESMAQTPVLRDLSGNGHDATCYNFAWTEESGISTTNYPNALVSDGVDDYAQVTGLPILTDYTIVAKRTDLSVIPDTVLASKRKQGVGTVDVSGAFQLERHFASNWTAFNFGSQNTINKSTDDIIYQTKSNYCGQNLSIGTAQDSDTMTLFKWNELSTVCANIALYSIILFNRTLTVEEIEWVKTNLIEVNDDNVEWYGVEFYTTSPYPDCIRIGNPELHKTLPVHTQMKGCLLSDDGTVNKYLNESNWTSETLDGSQGQVMVEMPKQSYWKFETDGNIRRVKFSEKPLPGFKPTPQGYVSAYEASLQRSTKKLSSVVNTDVDYRGGNNNAEWDSTYRSLLGMPATQISRTSFRDYARNRKADSTEWNCMTYDFQKLLYWLFVVEYATLNTQKAFNSAKTSEGYAQGGLGNGVTNLNNTKWAEFNGSYPFVPCGYTDEFGNGTGEVEFSMPEEYDSAGFTVKVPRYRGIENPFGHLWQWTDGINVRVSPNEPTGDGLSKVFVIDNPEYFNDSNYNNMSHVGNEARAEGYVKEIIFGEGGEIMPSLVGGGSTQFFCDCYYTNIPTSEMLCGVLFGASAYDGANAGLVYAISYHVPSRSNTNIGSRLCFIPNNN